MIDAIRNALQFISQAISDIVSFFENLVNSIHEVFTQVSTAVTEVGRYVSYFPASLAIIIGVALTVVVAYKVLGRD